ncbi:MAG: succinylglutamate desuccinylase/aspartoacylase family protein [Deltaproteobacteria bacterium]|nr:succinylglutamate desuccinylase/aspartoacylase family protein [Deltaproteobacteria bacterium]
MPRPLRAACLSRRALGAAVVGLTASRMAGAKPTQSTGVLAAGTRFETSWRLIDSGQSGPTVMVVAGIHGNELAPPEAAQQLRSEPLATGRMLIVPEASRPAIAAKSRYAPRSLYPNLNRNFPTRQRSEPRGIMAPALWDRTRGLRPDWVLDLHEGWGFRASSKSMGSSVVAAADRRVEDRLLPMAERVLAAVNKTITSPSKTFQLIRPGPNGSYARAVVEQLAIPALVLETTWVQPLELRLAQQQLMVRTVLRALGMLPRP